jgi:mannosyltransferase
MDGAPIGATSVHPESLHTVLDGLIDQPATSSPPDRPTARPARIGLMVASLAVAAAALSAAGSWIPSFWGDEAASLMSAQRSFPSLFTMLGHVDAVHGTYYVFLHFWIDVFGASPLSVRMPSAVAVGIAVAGAVVLANRLSGPRAALYAGLVAMFLPRLTSVGTEARSYAFSAALAIWLTVLLVWLMARPQRSNWAWVAYAALMAASAYVFLFSLLVPLAHGVILAAYRSSRRMLRPWTIATAGGVLMAAPVIVWGFLERNQISYLFKRDAATWQTILVGQWFGNIFYAAMIGILLCVAAIVGVRRWREHRPGIAAPDARGPSVMVVAGAVAFIPLAFLLLVNSFDSVYTNRYLAMSAPAMAVLIGYLVSRIPRVGAGVALAALSIAALPSYLDQRTEFAKNDSGWSQVARFIGDHASPGDAVVFDEATRPSLRLRLAMHSYPRSFDGLNDITLNAPYAKNTWWWDTTFKVKTVAARFDGVGRVWLLEYRAPAEAPDTYGLADLRALGFRVGAEYAEHGAEIYELTRPAPGLK